MGVYKWIKLISSCSLKQLDRWIYGKSNELSAVTANQLTELGAQLVQRLSKTIQDHHGSFSRFVMSLRYLDAWNTWPSGRTPCKIRRFMILPQFFWRCGRNFRSAEPRMWSCIFWRQAMPVPGNKF